MTVDPAFPMLALLLLAAVFAAAALAKLKDLEVFQGVVEQYRLLPRPLVAPFAYALPVVELLGALGLLLPATRPAAALLLILLLVAFAAAMAINLVRGRSDIDCGCFIAVRRQRIGWALVARNLFLASFGLTLLVAATARPLSALDWFTIVAGAASLILLYETIGRLFGFAPAAAARAG
jgi:uncharacterized membrane protein YphA (DoxX/SURF4 family)